MDWDDVDVCSDSSSFRYCRFASLYSAKHRTRQEDICDHNFLWSAGWPLYLSSPHAPRIVLIRPDNHREEGSVCNNDCPFEQRTHWPEPLPCREAENQIIMHFITVMHREEINAQSTQDSVVYGSMMYNVFSIRKGNLKKKNLVQNSNVHLVLMLVICGLNFV